ncbi:HAD family hydrolase, partial [Pseudomonas aeruginosa]
MPHPIDALISDCDGVLVDSEVIAERVMYEALSAYAPLEELQRLLEGTFGLTSRDILDRVEKHFGLRIPDSFNREVRQRSEEMVAQVQPIPGAREALLALDLPVAVASNSRRHSLERSLARAGLSELIGERLASADMVALPKPAPDVYLHAASLLGVAPERCLVVEDS